MSEEKEPEKNETPREGIPDSLLGNLHDANERFRRAREHVEQANGALVNPLEERQLAAQELHEAEQAVEEIEKRIEKEFGKK
ncbi:MAG TPA: hypothetical protein VFE47_25705 [Tepidisphaeraceae bacterium]|jgi:hypothetical protein|nr:hypothetical protein [Tepidisphaeraceae bacterium]